MMRRARSLGFRIELFYVGTSRVEINIERVRQRVSRGGHDVPEEDIRRRYVRSLANLPAAIGLVDEAIILDNSQAVDTGYQFIGYVGAITLWIKPLPEWAQASEASFPRSDLSGLQALWNEFFSAFKKAPPAP